MSETPIQINGRSLTMLANMTAFVQSMKEAKASKINVKRIKFPTTLIKKAATNPSPLGKELLKSRYDLLGLTLEAKMLSILEDILPSEVKKLVKQADYEVRASQCMLSTAEIPQHSDQYSPSRITGMRVGFKPEARFPDILRIINNNFSLLEEMLSCSPRHVVDLAIDESHFRQHYLGPAGTPAPIGYTGWLLASIGHLDIHITRLRHGQISFYVIDNRIPIDLQDESRDFFTYPVLYWVTPTSNYIQFIINPNQAATTNDMMMFFALYGHLTKGIAKTPFLLKLMRVIGQGIAPSREFSYELTTVAVKMGIAENDLILNRTEIIATSLIKALGSICNLFDMEYGFRRIVPEVVAPTGDPEVDRLAQMVADQMARQRR